MTTNENFRCAAYKKCGGCQLDVTYRQQLSYKQRTVIKLLGRFGRVSPIIGMDEPLGYRCKVSNAFGFSRGHAIYGIWQSSSGKIVQIDSCALEDSRAKRIVDTIRVLLPKFRLRTYDERTREGFLRFVTIRIGKATGEILVALGTGADSFPQKTDFAAALKERHPEITTIVQNVSTSHLNLLLGEKETVLVGKGYITDRLCGYDFRISARSFFQINPSQTEKLYATAVEFANLCGNERVIDAYCGVGTIGIIASKGAKHVTAVEVNADAVLNAKENVKINGIENVDVLCGDAGEFMKRLAKKGETCDVVFTDPPRAGCSREFLTSLITLAPKKVVYVSCNPETLSRDLAFLTKNDYKAEKIQPFDMFPYTKHVETVALLSRQIDMHKMKLNSAPFEMIKSGEKTIELRLYDEKRQQVKVGDKIVFTDTTTGETLNTTVVKLHRFDSFEELYKSLPLLKCGYTTKNVDNAKPSDMAQYYSVEEQNKYGVVGIELCRPKQVTDETVVLLTKNGTWAEYYKNRTLDEIMADNYDGEWK